MGLRMSLNCRLPQSFFVPSSDDGKAWEIRRRIWKSIVTDCFHLVYVGGFSGDYVESLAPFEREIMLDLLVSAKKKERESYDE